MVRTYTWNPSTQSSLTIIGNFDNESEKTVTNSLPATSTNLYSTQRFSNDPIYRPNYKNGQVTNISTAVPKDVHMSQSQTASLWQPHYHSFPICYPIPLDLPANLYHWRPHLLPPQITTPVTFEKTTNLRPVDLWHLRPIQIGSKVYYELVSSSSTLYSSPTSVVPYPVTSANLIAIPNNAQFQNGNLSHLPTTAVPVSANNTCGQSKLLHSETCGNNHSITSGNNGSINLPWTLGSPQPKSGIHGTPSWQTPLLITKEGLIFDRETNESSTISTFQNPPFLISPSQQLDGNLYQHSPLHKITPSLQHQCYRKVATVDSTEQYKRDLQLQIEQNRQRKEEERQRELEIEKKEMIKFEEYRRKAQQEIEEEERKEKEKILAAQRRAARMRTLQEEAALKARREVKNRIRRDVCCSNEGTKTLEGRTSSTVELNHLEWWEKKKEHVNDNAQRSTHSPVIPTLRKKNETSTGLSRNTAFEISANKAGVTSCVRSDRSNKSHSSSRLNRRCYHSSLTSRRNNSSDSVGFRRKSSHIH
ncbi:hypothetical protein LOAG_04207 [Loa loa]|uniref:CCDC66 domain-containing protein n=1 Tax=Loa loa TaxID=7209 RepID=A0A1S0U2I5_LOALO|nr:hypothetical protein LOAG_04207 [Loa loa]EFO24275.2 hypothetical protein LOAG_04207 [Loa loa]